MIKLFGVKKRAPVEGEPETVTSKVEEVKTKVSPGERRLKVDLGEIDLPSHAVLNFPDPNTIMKLEVFIDLTEQECYWKGGKYKFTITVPQDYPHGAPKAQCET